MEAKGSFGKTLFRIFAFAALINGAAFGGFTLTRFIQKARKIDYKVPIKAIIQTGPTKEALKTAYLAELLNLSVDEPQLTSEFDLKGGEAKLLASPVIKEAKIRIHQPGVLHVDYAVRIPLALLADFENMALDSEGYPFPVTPFFTPKTLPQLYLGIEEGIRFNEPLKGEKKELAYDLLQKVSGPIVGDLFNIVRIDVSHAFEKSYGKREIILEAEDVLFATQNQQEIRKVYPRLLRLSTKTYAQDLGNYLKLREQLLEKEKQEILGKDASKSKIIDFRIPQLAFIDDGN